MPAMPTAHVLQHIPLEGSGRIGVVAREMGFRVLDYRLFERAPPTSIPPGDLLVAMGGPMGVGDVGDPRWPFLQPEVSLLARSIQEGRAVLGVCLGAQLMAHALGARVVPLHVGEPPARLREVGWGAVTFDPSAHDDPALAGLHDSEVVVHWHGDTFDLPHGAVLLASTLLCPNQMFRFGRCAYGLQFHVELTGAELPEWVRQDAAFVAAANGSPGANRILADTGRFAARYERMGDRMIRNLLGVALETGV
jgi:GMP synthase (glutamine-hydrolysing)